MINPEHLETDQMARVVYLTVQAACTALQVAGVASPKLFKAHPTPLSEWAGATRGNLLLTLRVALGTIKESDMRRGLLNDRCKLRFHAARIALNECIKHAEVLPAGRACGRMPLSP